MRFLLDTNILIFLLKDPRNSTVARNLRMTQPDDVATSSIVISELISGAHRGHPDRLERNLATIRAMRFAILPFDDTDAEASGRIDALLKSRGQPIGPLDTLIAGQAMARGLCMITNNIREFSRIDGLTVLDWSR
jgi:tRNA(fMet)-specific endonuclease VapC